MTQSKWMGSCTQCWRQITYWIEQQTIYPVLAVFFFLSVYYMPLPQLLLAFSLLIPPPASFFPFHLYALYLKSLNKSWFFISVLRIQCEREERGPLNSLLRVQEQKSNSYQFRWLESTNFHDLDTWPISCSANGSSSFRLNQAANVGSNAPGGKSHAASPARVLTV